MGDTTMSSNMKIAFGRACSLHLWGDLSRLGGGPRYDLSASAAQVERESLQQHRLF
jgi:hypothetical protein